MSVKNPALKLLEKLLCDEIKSKTNNNVVQEMKYSCRMLETLRKYNNCDIETAQVIEELIQMAKEFQEALHFLETSKRMGKSIGFIDAHLLASIRLSPATQLWTKDRRLNVLTQSLHND